MLLAMNYKHCNRKIRQHLFFITELDANKFVAYVALAGSRRGGINSRSDRFLVSLQHVQHVTLCW
jgi:hypothetical protein